MAALSRWLAAAWLLVVPGAASANCPDPARYAALLDRHTATVADAAGVRVDYRALRGNADWQALVADLERCDPAALAGRTAELAFWINAYNILAIDLVQRHYPVSSIRDIGSLLRPVWKRPAGRIGGRSLSLDEIEHEILRPLGEPRIHAAIVCASVSCPPLRREPFEAARIDDQLDDALTRWLADPRTGARLDAGSNTLFLSKVFDWFAEDFEARGGVPRALRPYLGPELRAVLRAPDPPRIRFLDYDWSLNDLAAAGATGGDRAPERRRSRAELR